MKRRRNDIAIQKFGIKLKTLRLDKKFSQEDISILLDMDFSQYGRIERGQINVTISTIYDIANVLEIEVTELFLS